MKGLDTLIRLHKRTLDDLRRKMVPLETKKSQMLQAIKALQNELEREVALAKQQAEMSSFFGGFAKRIQTKQEFLYGEIRKLDQEIAKLNVEISAAFTELKKYEIAKEQSKERERVATARKETIELDDIATAQYIRKETQD